MRNTITDNTEFIKPSEELRESKKFTFKEIIGGEILTRNFFVKQLPFFLFIVLLILTYIANRNSAEKSARRLVTVQQENKRLRSRYISTSFELMNMSKQSEVAKSLNSRGLDIKESLEPPKKIIMTRD